MRFLLLFLNLLVFSPAWGGSDLAVIEEKKLNDGILYRHYVRRGQEPLNLHLLEIDLRKVRLGFQLAQNEILGRETVSAMVGRRGAIGGINGGFFEVYGEYQGDPEGLYVISGKILSEPLFNRSSIGFCDGKEGQKVLIDQIRVDSFIVSDGKRRNKVLGLNRGRRADDIVIYMPEFGPKTLTDDSGAELVVKNGLVSDLIANKGSNQIPKDGMVISASGRFRKGILEDIRQKSRVDLVHEVRSIRKDGAAIDLSGCSFTTAGPTLIMNRAIVPKFKNIQTAERHPRTAVGIKDEKGLIVVVVDGREPELSVGMSLGELANFLKSFGVSDAYNLDGGGSSTLVLQGKILNHPSDVTGERPVGDAILFLPWGQTSL